MFQAVINGLVVGALYALLALGFTLTYAATRFFAFAYGVIALIGAETAAVLLRTYGWAWPSALAAGIVVGALVSAATYLVILAPLRKRGASPTVLLVTSFGLHLVLVSAIVMIWGPDTRPLLPGGVVEAWHIGDYTLSQTQLIEFGSAVTATAIVWTWLTKSLIGLVIRASGDLPLLARSLGAPIERACLAAFLASGAIGTFAAELYGIEFGVRPNGALLLVLKSAVASIIGGLGSANGALYGGMLLGIIESLGIWMIGGQWRDSITFIVLAAFLLFRPQGIVGIKLNENR